MNKIKIIAITESLLDELGKFSTNTGLSKVEETQILEGLVAVSRIKNMFKMMYIEEKLRQDPLKQTSKTDDLPF